MRRDTSPAISVRPEGEAEIAYQTAGGALGLITTQGVAGSYGELRLAAGTNPAVTAGGGTGFRAVYVGAVEQQLWTATPGAPAGRSGWGWPGPR